MFIRIFLCCFVCLVFSSTPCSASDKAITFWTTEVESDRLIIQKKLAEEFKKKTNIQVKIIPIQENRLSQRVTAAFAAVSLPDVLYHPLDYTIGWADSGILNSDAATKAIKELGIDTFGQGPLNLVKKGPKYAAVPIDGWGQLLLYRKDLFNSHKLPKPDTWDNILKAAKTLHNPPLLWGFEVATDPGQTYTQQVFEHFALSNKAGLVDKDGKISLNTPQMIETLKFYKKLSKYTPPGNLYWLHTRMDYLSGRAAMIVWSPFILDELSGLRRDQPVSPDLIKGLPGFLAKNTGFITLIKGLRGKAQYGVVNYLGITRDAKTEEAIKWVKFLLGKGYGKWLSMAGEGKLPMRKGTKEKPEYFMDLWRELEFGVTQKAKISQFYGQETAKTILKGVDGFDRWGFAHGKGYLISQIYGSKVITRVLKRFLDGELTASEAADIMDRRVKALNEN